MSLLRMDVCSSHKSSRGAQMTPQEYQERCDEYFSYEDDIRERYHREAEDMRKEDEHEAMFGGDEEPENADG